MASGLGSMPSPSRLGFSLVLLVVLLLGQSEAHIDDLHRAQQVRPARHVTGSTAGRSAVVLNAFLARAATAHGHIATPCADFAEPALRAALEALHDAADADPLAPDFTRIYGARRDPRMRLQGDATATTRTHPRADSFDASPGSGLNARASSAHAADGHTSDAGGESVESLRWEVVQAGLCYEAGLVYAHHLSRDGKRKLQLPHGRLPLLPTHDAAVRVAAVLAAAPPDDAVLQAVGDQVVCARCHILPNTTVEPTQSGYVQAGPHVPLHRLEERRSVNGRLDTTLRVLPGRLQGPISMTVRTYEGSIPGE